MADQPDSPAGAHFYQLRLTCRDTVIDLDSEDPDFIDRQMRQWLGILTGPNGSLPSLPIPSTPQPSLKIPDPEKLEAEQEIPRTLNAHLADPLVLADASGSISDSVSPAVPKHLSGVASDIKPEVEELPLEPVEEPEPEPSKPFDAAATDISERREPREEELDLVVNTLMEDLQPPPDERASQHRLPMDAEEEWPAGEVADLGSLPVVSEVDQAAPSVGSVHGASNGSDVREYEALCNQVGAATAEDFLLMSAYFLTVRQQASPFTLTALNKLITTAGFEAVNHTVLATALTKGLLTMIPDVNGTAEATEYDITPHGRSTVEMFL